jgi:hypothetical protein
VGYRKETDTKNKLVETFKGYYWWPKQTIVNKCTANALYMIIKAHTGKEFVSISHRDLIVLKQAGSYMPIDTLGFFINTNKGEIWSRSSGELEDRRYSKRDDNLKG